jgi:hypothetical protein
MDTEERSQLVTTWIEHHKKGRAEGTPPVETLWAWEKFSDSVRDNPELAWELILQTLAADKSDVTIENLAAGPLEDFLVYHGKEFIDRIEIQAQSNPEFNELLGGVWENEIPPEVWRRVQKIREKVW